MPAAPTAPRWIDQLQGRGRYTFTRAQLESETDRSLVAAQTALRRLKAQGKVASPRRGFFVVVPPEHRAAGSPPASWFVDDLMGFLGQPYVGLLTAAALHGAGHQQPMVFQVVTDRPTRAMRSGKVSLRFTMRSSVEQMPVVDQQTETGTMRLATPETTAYDLVCYPAGAGHLSNVASVLAELSERMDGDALVEIAPLVRLPDVQRLGFLLEAVGDGDLARPLAAWLEGRRPRSIALDLQGGQRGVTEAALPWRVHANVDLDFEL